MKAMSCLQILPVRFVSIRLPILSRYSLIQRVIIVNVKNNLTFTIMPPADAHGRIRNLAASGGMRPAQSKRHKVVYYISDKIGRMLDFVTVLLRRSGRNRLLLLPIINSVEILDNDLYEKAAWFFQKKSPPNIRGAQKDMEL
jgi:hypothetical protein